MITSKNTKPGISKRLFIILGLILLVVAGVITVRNKKAQLAAAPPPQKALTAVTVAKAHYGTFTAGKKFLGTLRAKTAADISARISAYVIEVNVREGDKVGKDQILARLDDREQLDQVSGLEARLNAARTALATQQAIFQRDKKLFKARAVSRESLDLTTSRRDTAQAEVVTLEKQLDSARTNLSYTRLAAPFDGIVTARMMDQGDLALPGKTIIALEAPENGYYVEVKIPQYELAQIKTGDGLTLLPPGQDSGTEAISVTVSRIHPSIITGTLGIIEADISARPFSLAGGSIIAVSCQTRQYTGLQVPLRALLEQVDSAVVFSLSSDETIHLNPVSILYRGSNWAVIKGSGLNRDTRVVTAQESALLRLKEGQKVMVAAGSDQDEK
jgi:RND family efflux transporter MFP subunit